MKTPTVKYYVKHVSMEAMEDAGVEFGTDGREYEESENAFAKENMYKLLTNKQVKLIKLLSDGYSRKDAAKELDVHIQAVHQMVLRIRDRLRRKGFKN